jgi:hypothetical protein
MVTSLFGGVTRDGKGGVTLLIAASGCADGWEIWPIEISAGF